MWIDDEILQLCDQQIHLSAWVPRDPIVVLGASNQASVEVNEKVCSEKAVPVLRRYGGGGTVVLYPGCTVVSLGTWVKRDFHNQFYFDLLNRSLILGLEAQGVERGCLSQDGVSDVVFGKKKLVGTSLFRSRNYLLYQASLLVDVDFELIEQCLNHPSREPTYRRGRQHADFLMGVAELLPTATPESVAVGLREALPTILIAQFGDEMIEPQPAQFKNLRARVGRG